ncbi:MAG: hypothetical protein DI585_00520 [Pseudomonas fluorescens]|nr:MAG: hypothetical protein DI585_00520 [Pseudomonas fluorescens]
MRFAHSLALVFAVCLSPSLYAEGTSYIADFKAVDSALARHPAKFTGNPDVDFRNELIARRQNIIDISEVALSRANDPATIDFAQATIEKQKREIAELQRWIDKH